MSWQRLWPWQSSATRGPGFAPCSMSLLVTAALNGTIGAAKHQTDKQVLVGCLVSV